jgi:hypothetical protein
MLNKPQQLSFMCLLIATLALSSLFLTAGWVFGIIGTFIMSIVWGIFIAQNWNLGSNISIIIFVLAICLAATFETSRSVLLVSLLAALSTWDLAAFHNKLSICQNIADIDHLTRTHLSRLIIVLILGLSLSFLTFGLQLNLKFWQVFVLGIMLLVSLTQVFKQLRQSSNE